MEAVDIVLPSCDNQWVGGELRTVLGSAISSLSGKLSDSCRRVSQATRVAVNTRTNCKPHDSTNNINYQDIFALIELIIVHSFNLTHLSSCLNSPDLNRHPQSLRQQCHPIQSCLATMSSQEYRLFRLQQGLQQIQSP